MSLYFYWRPCGCQRRNLDIPPQAFFGIPPASSSAHQPLHPRDHQNRSGKSSQGPHLPVAPAVSGRGYFRSFITDRKCNFVFQVAAPCAGTAMEECPAGMPRLKKERSGRWLHSTVRDALGETGGRKKRAGAVKWDHLGKWSSFPSLQFQTCSPSILR